MYLNTETERIFVVEEIDNREMISVACAAIFGQTGCRNILQNEKFFSLLG